MAVVACDERTAAVGKSSVECLVPGGGLGEGLRLWITLMVSFSIGWLSLSRRSSPETPLYLSRTCASQLYVCRRIHSL